MSDSYERRAEIEKETELCKAQSELTLAKAERDRSKSERDRSKAELIREKFYRPARAKPMTPEERMAAIEQGGKAARRALHYGGGCGLLYVAGEVTVRILEAVAMLYR